MASSWIVKFNHKGLKLMLLVLILYLIFFYFLFYIVTKWKNMQTVKTRLTNKIHHNIRDVLKLYNHKLMAKSKEEISHTNQPSEQNLSRIIERSNIKHNYKSDGANKLIAFYNSLGIRLTGMDNLKVLTSLLERKDTLRGKTSSNDTTVNISAYIKLRYPEYEHTLPYFINESHKIIFLKNEKYRNMLEVHNSSIYLNGFVELFSGGRVSENIRNLHDCGQETNTKYFKGTFPNTSYAMPNLKNNSKFPVVVPLLERDGFTFQHFLDRVLPKLAQLTPILMHSNMYFVLFKPRDKIIYEILKDIGISPDRIIFYKRGQQELRVQRHYRVYRTRVLQLNTRLQLNICINPPAHPILMQQVRKLLGVSEMLPISVQAAYVVLLTRKGNHNGGRNIINEPGVIDLLRRRYGNRTFIFPGPMNLIKTKEIFGKSRILIGVHGGALYNLHFAPTTAIIIEYLGTKSDGFVEPNIGHTLIWTLAQNVGQTYYRIIEEPANKQLDIKVNIGSLEKILDRIDKSQLI